MTEKDSLVWPRSEGELAFSVIVPTRDRKDQLSRCLDSLADLEYPRSRFEIIVVDDGSRSSPQEVISSYEQRVDVTLLTQPNKGPAAARNTGANRAHGTYLALIDDDCVADRNWLRELESEFASNPASMLGGEIVNGILGNPFSTASQMISDAVYHHYNADPQRASFFSSNNLACPSAEFRRLGGFDESFRTSEDRDLCDRWLSGGRPMIYVHLARVEHHHELTFLGFLHQHFEYGRGSARFHSERMRRRGSASRFEAVSFYRRLVTWPFGQVSWAHASGQSFLIFTAQVASAIGFAWERLRSFSVGARA